MQPFYEQTKDNLEIHCRRSRHLSPHLHKSLECIYITKGTLELGIGQELYHMEEHDFAIIFPEIIHHCQVFSRGENQTMSLFASPTLSGGYLQTLTQYCPAYPILSRKELHPDIPYALESLKKLSSGEKEQNILQQAFLQIILARTLPLFEMVEKSTVGSDDIIYRTVAYISGHFTEPFSLTDMARDLGYSPYALSRVFSGTFHTNFNQYVNELRLNYACSLLQHTDQSVTDIWLNAGFNSQRTFNRVFKERYHISPREYRESDAAR